MFDKFKEAKKIKEMQNELSKETATVEKKGVKVTVNGKMRVESVEIDESVSDKKVGKLVTKCTNKAMKKVQKTAAKKMKGMDMGGM